ncbi:DUF6920 family protein [Orenia marismortui]|uniref:DUF6920 family protein n=1 Tax=Orenia marismortui TaxID=46469 RepID=UPI0003704771|nr:DUF6544 family protein [Orenia marismortui]
MGLKHLLTNYWWGILIGILLLIILAFIIANLQMRWKISREVELLMNVSEQKKEEKESRLIIEKDLEILPKPVKKWLKYVGVVGQEKIRTVTFSQRGKMRLDPKQEKWVEAKAKQYVRVDEPGYLWHVDLPMIPVVHIKGRDLFYEGKASIEIRIGSLIPVVNVGSNKKVNESSLHRFLLELPWYPTAAIENYITWEALNKQSAKAILSYRGISVEAIFYFKEDGELSRIESLRYKESDKEAERIPCIGEIKGQIIVDGLKIPHRIDVTWIIDGKAFTWYKLENFDIHMDRK